MWKSFTLGTWLHVGIFDYQNEKMIVGIDATNLRRGGGVTHLVELLANATPEKHQIVRVVVWGGEQTLTKVVDQKWLKKISPAALNHGLFRRSWWQWMELSRAADAEHCDILFVPGGNYAGSYRPFVTMSRNLLPFEWRELRRYGFGLITFKLLMLRFAQSRSYRKADGVIFLTDYAKQTVLNVSGKMTGKSITIPHGLNPRFKIRPKAQYSIENYSAENPFRLLYVSIIDQYKHQWHVVEAVRALRVEGLPIVLDLVGPAYKPALKRLESIIAQTGPDSHWVHYHGAIPYEDLHQIYQDADMGVFASSCENMPNILLETMAAGLPIVCSNRGPMPEVLGDSGLYFDPENSVDIANAVRTLVRSPELRGKMAEGSFKRSEQYSWKHAADATFSFLASVAQEYHQ